MKKRKNFLLYLTLIAFVIIGLLAFLFSGKTEENESVPEEVDYTSNILKNSGFESGDFYPWKVGFKVNNTTYALIDDLVKFSGSFSLNISSEKDTGLYVVSQVIKPIQIDKKIIFNARVRTEDVSNAFIRIQLFSFQDSLLVQAYSDTLKNTNDWVFLTTWLRTVNQQSYYIKVDCCLYGSGRVWFDKLELYPVDIKEKNFFQFITR